MNADELGTVRIRKGFRESLGAAVVALPEVDLAEFSAALEAFLDRRAVEESAQADGAADAETGEGAAPVVGSDQPNEAVDESAHAGRDPPPGLGRAEGGRVMEMVRTALAHAHEGQALVPTATWCTRCSTCLTTNDQHGPS